MTDEAVRKEHGNETLRSNRKRNVGLLAVLGALWLVFDIATKAYFNSGAFSLGEHIAGPFLGLFRFTLVHNTGAAWGMFGTATVPLAIVSIVVSAIFVAFLVYERRANVGQAVGIALIVAGGIGNAIDRFSQGYVVDFIDFTFIDFPVFNIADIGVTCGLVILVVATFVSWRSDPS